MACFMKTLVQRSGHQITHRFPPSPAVRRFYSTQPPPPSRVEEACLVGTNTKGITQIYNIRLSRGYNRLISPLTSKYDKVNRDAITVCSGSNLYFIGGQRADTRKAQKSDMRILKRFDMSNPDKGFRWTNVMDTKRTSLCPHAALALDGRVYVFGGRNINVEAESDQACWSEYYDIVKDKWVPLYKYASVDLGPHYSSLDSPDSNSNLKESNHKMNTLYAMAFDDNEFGKIIMVRGTDPDKVFVRNVSKEYNIILNNGSSMKIPHTSFRGMFETPVRVGQTLYWLNINNFGFSIEAYNLRSQVSYSGPIPCYSQMDRGRFLTHLGGIDNEFCFFTSQIVGNDTTIQCTTIDVSESKNYGYSRVAIKDVFYYLISDQQFKLSNVFPIVH